MPGYGLLPPDEGTGLLPWSWAEERLESTSYGIEMLDPAKNASFRIHPEWAFGLEAGDFTGSPTRWDFKG